MKPEETARTIEERPVCAPVAIASLRSSGTQSQHTSSYKTPGVRYLEFEFRVRTHQWLMESIGGMPGWPAAFLSVGSTPASWQNVAYLTPPSRVGRYVAVGMAAESVRPPGSDPRPPQAGRVSRAPVGDVCEAGAVCRPAARRRDHPAADPGGHLLRAGWVRADAIGTATERSATTRCNGGRTRVPPSKSVNFIPRSG